MSNAVFYHAGCPVCLGAEQMLVNALDLIGVSAPDKM